MAALGESKNGYSDTYSFSFLFHVFFKKKIKYS